MKTMNMISRRNFLKAALGAAAVSAFSLTGCGGSASSAASGTASSAAAFIHTPRLVGGRFGRSGPDLQGGHRQLCGPCLSEPDRRLR